ncbi:synaptonemal complex assembly [Mactra antiquata]
MTEEMSCVEKSDDTHQINSPQKQSTSENGAHHPCDIMAELNATLAEPLPENSSVQFITNTAHQLVDSMNSKRKNDRELLEQFRLALDAQVSKAVMQLEEYLFQMYEKKNVEVQKKLEELFSCLDCIKQSESNVQSFGESLKHFVQE